MRRSARSASPSPPPRVRPRAPAPRRSRCVPRARPPPRPASGRRSLLAGLLPLGPPLALLRVGGRVGRLAHLRVKPLLLALGLEVGDLGLLYDDLLARLGV